MCGICGIVSSQATGSAEERILAIRSRLEHRGPDDKGLHTGTKAVFAATRLAIRGHHDGQQPVVDPETGVAVVCNGEIDNHRELRAWIESRGLKPPAEGDIGVLPYLYALQGPGFIASLEGPFALALWDPRKEELLLARDRVGERPLFYAVRDSEVIFATEISALVADSSIRGAPSSSALGHYLRFGRFRAPATVLSGVHKVAAAELVRIRAGEITRERYWRWPLGTARKTQPSVDAFDAVFRGAVRRQTECDVDFGFFLSGGVDSSLVAAVARELHPDRALKSFTLRFDEASYDEGDAAAHVAAHLGLDNESVWVRAEDFPVTIRELVGLVGEPLADPAWVPTALLARRAARDVKVVLVGEGGDEVFGGYPTYIGAGLADLYGRMPRLFRRAIASGVRRLPPSDRKVTLSFLLKRFVDGYEHDALARHSIWTSTIAPDLLARLGCEGGIDTDASAQSSEGHPLDAVQRHDLENQLAEGLLTKSDRASMGWALEPRAPFLDSRVLAFASTLPPRERVSGLRTKVFLKRYARRYLPRSVVYQRKRGLSVPLSAWLRGSLLDWARERLSSGRLALVGVDGPAALAIYEDHLLRKADHGRTLWTLLVLVEWLEWWETNAQPREVTMGLSRCSAPPIAR